MADDGMLLNFQLGTEPLKRQVKFTGGRWRDRKRAEKSARDAASGGPKPVVGKRDDGDFTERAPKRQRFDDDGENGYNSRYNQQQPREGPRSGRRDGGGGSGGGRPQHHDKGSRQVVSRLFSFNPAQKTEFDDEEKKKEWTAPEATNAPLSDVANFGTLELASRLVDELGKMGLERPTAIQKKVIPHLLSSSGDAFVQAETGSGKTFAYLLPMLHRVLQLSARDGSAQVHRDSGVFGIIVAPTRELARQTHTVLEQLIRPFPWLVSTSITGGESKKAEKSRIRKGVNFLVATPGRLADHIDNTQALNLGTVRWLILDEGDRLMDLGFEEDLKKAINALKKVDLAYKTASGTSLDTLPGRRVSVLCSATMKMNVQRLGEMSLAEATFLAADKADIDDPTTATTIGQGQDVHKAPAQLHQSHLIVPAKLRLVTLISYLRSVFSRRGRTMKVIVFLSCADSVDFHYELLRDPNKAEERPAEASGRDAELLARTVSKAAYVTTPASPEVILHRMHGSLSQPTRTATIRSFSACKQPSVLITTDVSSRGLDIPSVDLVIEYDPAFSFPDHIHRVGRTARAGRSGDAVLFLLPGTEEGYIELLKTAGSPTAQSFETVLQNGLMSKIEFPVETSAKPTDGQTYHNKAETIQLHLEQRILSDNAKQLLELARNGFKSHIRAYATHTKEERKHFDITELHLGHTAKSFALREPPGGIGNGIDRKSKKNHKGGKDRGTGRSAAPSGSTGTPFRDDGGVGSAVDSKAAQDILRKKSMMLMNAGADEFNIG
ncbi:ATP-dependent RNA helicase DDX31/DBP7 [Geosmithia morbida]|uniref:ATP-dependent RNA helicase n=1 Tax=Geosmithia morbida TaxID=1094350 RepID=A0A9P4Z4V3_9HYPO|nr:ATP-dependent RNA helicase DDX31/DBP7 [Geosmithia morbida]KAF4126704.1 ATP-dependent RNA helicase DDX31/DBP7 [Geosmithia morbida]